MKDTAETPPAEAPPGEAEAVAAPEAAGESGDAAGAAPQVVAAGEGASEAPAPAAEETPPAEAPADAPIPEAPATSAPSQVLIPSPPRSPGRAARAPVADLLPPPSPRGGVGRMTTPQKQSVPSLAAEGTNYMTAAGQGGAGAGKGSSSYRESGVLRTSNYPEALEGLHKNITPVSLNVRSLHLRQGRNARGKGAGGGGEAQTARLAPQERHVTTAREAAVGEGVGGGGGAGRFPADKWMPHQPVAQQMYHPTKDLVNWNMNGGRTSPSHTVYHSTFYSVPSDFNTWHRPQQSFAVAERFPARAPRPREPKHSEWGGDRIRGDIDYEAAETKAGIVRREQMSPYRFTVSSMRSSTDRFGPPALQVNSLGSTSPRVGPGRYNVRGKYEREATDPIPVASPRSSMIASSSPRITSEWLPHMSKPSGATRDADNREWNRIAGAGRFGHDRRRTGDMVNNSGGATPGSCYYEITRWPPEARDVVHRGNCGFYSDFPNPLAPQRPAEGSGGSGGGGGGGGGGPRGLAAHAL